MKQLLLLFLLILALDGVEAAYIDYDDNWYGGTSENQNGDDDGIVWGGRYLDIGMNSVRSDTDMVCWDWNGDGMYTSCFFQTGVNPTICDEHFFIRGDDGHYHYPSYFNSGSCNLLQNEGCDHAINTGSEGGSWSMTTIGGYGYDCDEAAAGYSELQGTMYVVNRHTLDCNNGASSDLDYEASYGSWLGVVEDIECPYDWQDCDENHDDYISYDIDYFWFVDDYPCRTMNGYWCSVDDDCISDDCVGTDYYLYRNDCVDYDTWDIDRQEHERCCGSECVSSWTTYWGPYPCAAGYACDYEREHEQYYDPYAVEDLCFGIDGTYCSTADDCLTGYYCVNHYCSQTTTYCGDGVCAPGENCPADGSGPEACDNIDNNCNGQIDDGLTQACSQNYFGICAVGTETCTAGTWHGCPLPETEVCDGQDDDCDNVVDDGDICPTIQNHYINPQIVPPGLITTYAYYIRNPNSYSMDVFLGASVRDPDGIHRDDYENDIVVTVNPGTEWYYRNFFMEHWFMYGMYDVLWGIHTSDLSFMYDLKEVPDYINITYELCADFDFDFDVDSDDVAESIKIYFGLPNAQDGWLANKNTAIDCIDNYDK